MPEVLIAAGSALASFIGSYAAIKTHLHYLRRDVDLAHSRIDRLQEAARCGLKPT